MLFLVISALVGMACADNLKLFERQGSYQVLPGASVVCSPEDFCGIYCLRTSQFCCPTRYPCVNGEYCLGGSICCFDAESPADCASRNNVVVPPGFSRQSSTSASAPAPASSSSEPVETPSVLPSSTSIPVLPSTSSVPVITPSYPLGNASIPAPTGTATGTGVATPSVTPFTGGAERLGQMGTWVLGFMGAVGLLV